MKRLSSETNNLIDKLYQHSSFWNRLLGEDRESRSILANIERNAEPMAIPRLLPFTLQHKGTSRAAAATMHRLLAQLDPVDLIQLDMQVRSAWFPNLPLLREWQQVSPSDLKRLQLDGECAAAVLGMSSFHNNGYVREQAVRQLAEVHTGSELSFLLIRINDWVPIVREVAQSAVQNRLKSDYAQHFVRNLALVQRLVNCSRNDHSSLVASITDLLQQSASFPALSQGLDSDDRLVRRACFDIAFGAEMLDRQTIVWRGIQSKDNMVRLSSATKLHVVSDDTLPRLLAELRYDSYMPIRREALNTYIRQFPELAVSELEAALLDTHAFMRQLARFHIEKTGPKDFSAFYRQALDGGSDTYAAIGGLGETGKATDDQLLVPFLTDKRSRIRRAATRALAKLNPDEHVDVFLQMMSDTSRGVSREAARALCLCTGHLVSTSQLWEQLQSASEQHVKNNLTFLLARQPKWSSLHYLLLAMSLGDEFITHLAQQSISRWLQLYNRTFTVPRKDELDRIGNAFRGCSQYLSTHDERELASILHSLAKRIGEPQSPPYQDLDTLAGTWSKEQSSEFRETSADFEQVDDKIWR